MSSFKELLTRESCFRPGSTLCPGCMEAVAFQNIGRITDNGIKTIFTMGTFCGEVSTLMWPKVVAWGRGTESPDLFAKSFSILHNVFESSPTVAEAVRDTADILSDVGALKEPVQVLSCAGDGGSLAIGLRTFLHTIQRGARVTLVVMINEVFANTGFQWAPTSTGLADSATTPVGSHIPGNPATPMNHIGLALMAGAGLVAQVSPAFPAEFNRAAEAALSCDRTAVLFIPSPCITGWKFGEGETEELAELMSKSGLFPCFFKKAGEAGSVKHVDKEMTSLRKFLGAQRRFHHLVRPGPSGPEVVPGREAAVARLEEHCRRNVARLEVLARWDV